MLEFRVLLSREASADLENIADYITFTLREPATARQQISKLRTAIESLQVLPIRHGLVQDSYLAAQGIRMLPVHNYLIFYFVQEETKTVTVLRIVHGRRDWNYLFKQ